MTQEQQNVADRLIKIILKCQRNHYKPDIHSFLIDLGDGDVAYVEGRIKDVYVETYVTRAEGGRGWCCSAEEAAEFLASRDARLETLVM